jgi:hypothetical protein
MHEQTLTGADTALRLTASDGREIPAGSANRNSIPLIPRGGDRAKRVAVKRSVPAIT